MISRISVLPVRRRLRAHPWALPCLLGLALGLTPLSGQDVYKSNFESSLTADNPWSGVTSAGLISVIPGGQRAVNNSGKTVETDFAPSIAVGDLNGDGLKDMVIADPKGFFWYFPNSGTPTQPKFTSGEVMPIWLGAASNDPDFKEGGCDNVIPRIQLVDAMGDGKKPDLLVGNYTGRLFYLHNTGSASNPAFHVAPSQLGEMEVKTRKEGLLWCNYMAPCMYAWFGGRNLDLIMGDGSYAANSIFLFTNKGTTAQPTFNEDFMTKLIPGMGREQLTPQVIDWNNDGKPDIITGDRLGHLTLFLNTSTDENHPSFDEAKELTIAGKDTFGEMTAVTVCDLTGNKLPNLIVSNNKGEILYALNTGKPGAPQFNTLVPMMGKSPFPQIQRPIGWGHRSPNNPSGLSEIPRNEYHGVPYGVAYELLVCTNAKVEPGFEPPQNTTLKNALRFYVQPNQNVYFPQPYRPVNDPLYNDQHGFTYSTPVVIKEGTAYHVSMWMKSSGGIRNLAYRLGGDFGNEKEQNYEAPIIGESISPSNGWSKYEGSIQFRWGNPVNIEKHRNAAIEMTLWFDFSGEGSLYLDDITITPEATP